MSRTLSNHRITRFFITLALATSASSAFAQDTNPAAEPVVVRTNQTLVLDGAGRENCLKAWAP